MNYKTILRGSNLVAGNVHRIKTTKIPKKLMKLKIDEVKEPIFAYLIHSQHG